MSNIQTCVTGRHDWQVQKLKNPFHPKTDERGFARGLLCINCRKPWFEDLQGDPPVKGCASDIKVRNVGPSRQKDYLEQEMRERDRQERNDRDDFPDIELVQVPRESLKNL